MKPSFTFASMEAWKPVPGDGEACQRSDDRVTHQPGLVGKQRQAETDVDGGKTDVTADRAHVAALGDALTARQQAAEDREHRCIFLPVT